MNITSTKLNGITYSWMVCFTKPRKADHCLYFGRFRVWCNGWYVPMSVQWTKTKLSKEDRRKFSY